MVSRFAYGVAGRGVRAKVRPPIVDADEQLVILRALEQGKIDVDEASRRLADLAGSGSGA